MPAPASEREFPYEALVPVGAADGSENAWVRIRSTASGIDMVQAHIARLEERARKAEDFLASANERCRQLEKRAERADWTAGELRRSEFEWEDAIPVDEINGKRILVQVRGTEGGIKRLKAFIAREKHAASKLHESLLAAEAKLAALEAEQAEVLASIEGFEALPSDASTYTVSHGGATMTVTGSPSGVAQVVKLAYGGFEYGVSA